MGTVEGSYCLKWNDFTTNLSCAFNELRDDEDFFDVTLLTEESEIRCHKLILGACSPHFRYFPAQIFKIFFLILSFFRAIIKRLSSVQNPAIYLRGVRHEDIKNILEFMYLGEVSVSQEDLDSFLSVAQDLCIKGLTQSESKPGPSRPVKAEPSTSYATPPPPLPPPPAKKPRMQVIQRNNGNNPHAPAKAEPKMEIQEDHDDIEVLDDDDPSQIEEYDGYYQEDDGAGPSDADLDGKGKHIFFYIDDFW